MARKGGRGALQNLAFCNAPFYCILVSGGIFLLLTAGMLFAAFRLHGRRDLKG